MDILKKTLPFTGIIILIIILWKWINLKLLIVVLKNFNIKYFFFGVFSTFFIISFKILRIYNTLKENKINIPFFKYLEIYCNANLLTMVTNLMFSETASAIAVMYNQKNKTKVAYIYFLCNFADLLSISLICLISFFINLKFLKNFISFKIEDNMIYFFIFLLIIGILIFIFGITKKFFYIKKVLFDLKEVIIISFKNIIKFTILIYFFYILACYFNAMTFNINLNIFYLIFVYTLGSLISIIPISINGFGTREALFIFLLKLKGIPSEKAFALSIFAFAIVVVINLLLIYLYVLIRKLINK